MFIIDVTLILEPACTCNVKQVQLPQTGGPISTSHIVESSHTWYFPPFYRHFCNGDAQLLRQVYQLHVKAPSLDTLVFIQ